MSASELQEKIDAVEALVKSKDDDKRISRDQADRKIELLKLAEELAEKNAGLTGVGLRYFAGMTRGKGSQVIQWQAFDVDKPETLPTKLDEFCNIAGVSAEHKALLPLLFVGYNDKAYTEASDPIQEYVNPAWDPVDKAKFKLAVRTVATMQDISFEEAVNMIKPGVEKKFLSSKG